MLQPGTPEYEQAKGFVEQWKIAGPALEEQRERDIRATDTMKSMSILGGMMDLALRDRPLRDGSGLVEAQKVLMKGRRLRGGN